MNGQATSHNGGGCGTISVPNGTYTYTLTADDGYKAIPSDGSVTVSGTGFTVYVNFWAYTLAFSETGLPTNIQWTVELFWADQASWWWSSSSHGSGPPIDFSVPNGTWRYSVPTVVGYSIEEPNGSYANGPLNGSAAVVGTVSGVGGSTVTIDIRFAKTFSASFSEVGLPAGTEWSVTLNGSTASSTTSTITFAEPNGAYAYVVGTLPGYDAFPLSGLVTVSGATVNQEITFTVANYTVSFTETGLLPGDPWSVTFNATTEGSTVTGGPDTIDFPAPNGTYAFTVDCGPNSSTPPLYSYLTVAGGDVPIDVACTPTFLVTFEQSDASEAPLDESWTVVFDGIAQTALDGASSIVFQAPNGTYAYSVPGLPGFVAIPPRGEVAVAGADQTTDVTYYQVNYTVSIRELGLPRGIHWSVTADGTLYVAPSGQAITFDLPNGTYDYQLSGVPGYHESTIPYAGTITLNGSGIGLTLRFKPFPYAVVFRETGLPSGTVWNVSLGHAWILSNNTTATFGATNATYAFTVTSIGYTANPFSGNVTVSGGSGDVSITFTAIPSSTYSVTFSETGLPSGTSWSVTLGGSTLSSMTRTITFTEPNGTYTYGAIPAGAYYAQSGGNGTFTVNGAAHSFSVAYAWTVTLTFSETGLPIGSTWTINVTAADPAYWEVTSSASNIMFHLPANASYSYTITAPSGQSVSTSSGSATLGDAGQTVPTVTISPTSTTASSTFPWTYVIIGVVIAAVAVGMTIALMRHRRPPATVVSPLPPTPPS